MSPVGYIIDLELDDSGAIGSRLGASLDNATVSALPIANVALQSDHFGKYTALNYCRRLWPVTVS